MQRYSDTLKAAEIKALVGDSPVILEIGSNEGVDTQRFLDAMPGCRVWCFEPDPRPIARWRERIKDPRASLIEAAICDKDGMAMFHGSSGTTPGGRQSPDVYCPVDDWDLSGSLLAPTGHLDYSRWVTFPAVAHVPVKTLRLDTWALESGFAAAHPDGIDFIWCDVQGAEHLVIEGGRWVLSNTRWFYTEFSNKEMYAGQKNLAELESMLSEAFVLEACYANNALFHNHSKTQP